MSLEDIRSECSDIAALLQPYVDGEVASDEQEKVAEHLQRCSGCRSAVSEQAWVRATLQSVERERAPQAVRARILQGLDDIDGELANETAAQAPPGWASQIWNRVRDLGRGGLIMVPAGAVAVGLFFMARQGAVPTTEPTNQAGLAGQPGFGIGSALMPGTDPDTHATSDAAAKAEPSGAAPEAEMVASKGAAAEGIDDELLRHVRELRPSVGFDVQLPADVRRPRTGSAQIQLVSAALDQEDPAADPSVRLRYALSHQGRAAGHLVDRQLRAASFDAPGQPVSVGGRRYRLHRTGSGEPVVYFELRGIMHALMFEGPTDARHTLAPGVGAALPDGTPADYGPLLRVAEQLRAASAGAGTAEPR